ncbi:MAG: hypothetical protein Q8868_02950 [Bacteroidota bacterium]|nr:hypothetical protein [Bacteroidota bacterium]
MMIKVRANIFCLFLQLISLAGFSFVSSAQSNAEKRKTFTEAESFNLFDQSELANPLYLLLDKPDNYNIQYKIGTCYLRIDGEKEKAIPFLESAVKHASYDAKVNSFREKRAPLDAYFFLGKAYMINNELDKALSTFEVFKKLTGEVKGKGSMRNESYIDQLIEACKAARSYQDKPIAMSSDLVSPGFSQGSINEDPAVSFDGNSIVYTERRGMVNAILYSKKIRGKWQPPIEITSQIKAGDDCSSCSLNKDGTLLFLYKTDNYDGNIYTSEYIDGSWTVIKKLNRNINTKYYESHASISADGKKLYFTSNREGGEGGLDIYVSEKDGTGDWGPAKNLGPGVNTIYNEDTPFITANDSILYFSSEGYNSTGGYDIYRSRLSEKGWSQPENLGFPINSTDDDRFFQPFNNDENGFYSMTTGYKNREIFYITLSAPKLNRIFELTGKYGLKDTVLTFSEKHSIYLIDKDSGDTLNARHPDSKTGRYNFMTVPGRLRLVYTCPGYNTQWIDTTITMDNPSRIINLADIVLDKNPREKIDLSKIPGVSEVDTSILIKNLNVKDVTSNDMLDTTILYYTVQVMALYHPVDISYFKYVSDIKVFYNGADLFYRYTTGIFNIKNDAYNHLNELIDKGYPDDLFVKKVTRATKEKQIPEQKYYTIQLSASPNRTDIGRTFPGLSGVREVEEIDGFHYFYGQYTSAEEARTVLNRPQLARFSGAFIREIKVIVKK